MLLGGLVWDEVATRRPAEPNLPGPVAVGPPSARQILDQRYARGDLGTEEYRERAQTLEA